VEEFDTKFGEQEGPCFRNDWPSGPGITYEKVGETDYWRVKLTDKKGGDPAEWPEDLRVREFPDV
jgi:hypothetical protein